MFLINLYSDTFVEFYHPVKSGDFFSFDNKYVEADHEDPDFYIMFYQEFYLMYNCRFTFDIFGGVDTLDDSDFIDVALYLDERNLKNVYKKLNFKFINKNKSFLNDDIILNYKNKNITFKYNNLNIYNIEFNTMLKDEVNDVKRIKYIKYIKHNMK
jgi:hypothetical protein